MAVTLKEIAKELGVSTVTVSKVLRNHEDISKKTRELVLRRAKERGYRPNLTARSLVTGKSSLVGILVPDLMHTFFVEVARSLAATLRERGVYLLICSSEGDPDLERHQLEHLLSRGLDAIVVAPLGGDEEILASVVHSRTLLVLIDRKIGVPNTHFIGSDDFAVGEIATRHLLEQGCKRIAHLRGPANSVGEERLQGYLRALRAAGMPLRPEFISPVSSGDVESKMQGRLYAEAMLKADSRPDSFFCYSDPVAIGAMQATLQLNLHIPRQVAIVGCGNLHFDEVLRVPLSSVDQCSSEIGHSTAELILAKTQRGKYDDDLEVEPDEVLERRLKPHLIVRESSLRRQAKSTSTPKRSA